MASRQINKNNKYVRPIAPKTSYLISNNPNMSNTRTALPVNLPVTTSLPVTVSSPVTQRLSSTQLPPVTQLAARPDTLYYVNDSFQYNTFQYDMHNYMSEPIQPGFETSRNVLVSKG